LRDYDNIISALAEAGIETLRNTPMSSLTSFGIGGPADLLVKPISPEEISLSLRILAEEGVPVFVIGRGTNLLPSDDGFRGALLRPSSLRCDPWKEGNFIAGAALSLNELIDKALRNGLAGGEALAGIPGSVGGAIAMNAGAYEKWTADTIAGVVAFDLNGEEIEIDVAKAFGYRSFVMRGKAVIAEAEFSFKSLKDTESLIEKAREYDLRRKSTQPIGERSAGCIFVNPPGDHAGRLIEEAGLKGTRIGGAEVSDIHANFIVNKGGATAKDVIGLIYLIRESVLKEFGIELETEVITPGYEI
jgi:UDP-N-acetylmuramate dehydrogenase